MTTSQWPAGEAAFVTGAASGIGLGVARALVAAGAKVALADIDGDRLSVVADELTNAGGTVIAVPFDVGDADLWEVMADRAEASIGPISILSNIAGVNGGGPIDETPLEVWRWVYRINIEAQFIAAATFLPRFKGRGGRAHILNTASIAGVVPMAPVAAYSSSKSASVGFTFVLRDELKNTDIGVSLLVPGSVDTRINTTAGQAEAELLGREMDTELAEANSRLLAKGADPDRVGEQVVEAMKQQQFVIVTHREWHPLVQRVHDEIENAYTEFDGRHGVDPTAEVMLQGVNPISS